MSGGPLLGLRQEREPDGRCPAERGGNGRIVAAHGVVAADLLVTVSGNLDAAWGFDGEVGETIFLQRMGQQLAHLPPAGRDKPGAEGLRVELRLDGGTQGLRSSKHRHVGLGRFHPDGHGVLARAEDGLQRTPEPFGHFRLDMVEGPQNGRGSDPDQQHKREAKPPLMSETPRHTPPLGINYMPPVYAAGQLYDAGQFLVTVRPEKQKPATGKH